MNRLVLIDGNAVLHRAFHAIPPLTAPDGSVVNAVYGFATMLLRLYHDLNPTYMIVAFDRPKPTFRKKMYKKYQATRPKMDEALVGQIEKVHELVRAFGIPIFEKDGFEADDVIGTLCKKALGSVIPGLTRDPSSRQKLDSGSEAEMTIQKTGFRLGGRNDNKNNIDQIIIVTGDRDILQLVDETTYVYMPTKGLSEAKLYKDADVKERMGVAPKKIPDFKGLAGDASDNYPGVEGIGPKTAIALLERFGSVEGVYIALKKKDKRLKEVSSSVIKKLEAGKKDAALSKDLATIRTTVDVTPTFDKPMTSLDTKEARKFFDHMHFHSLLKRLTNGGATVEMKKTKKSEKTKDTSGEQQQLF
ncbi:MAG TPA: 5'-3' exonuclease H3TH domain-containing protein [Patescibacteria group bacterium]|nr:5'-3' exonuclease H3TH domain-containing protein [Patescibacteria group bacterium]